MLHINEITFRIAGRALFERASLAVPAGARLALVGRNGTGKSTLLKLITGEYQVDEGQIRLQKGCRIGMVAQEAPGGRTTPLDAVLSADTERAALLEEASEASEPLRIAEIHNRLSEIAADSAPARAARILKGLGFDDEAQTRPLSAFSGGWRMRVALAGVLFLEPDLLLLDEPTNHLDLEAAMWLEEHLRRYPRTLILVSHDRDFLNAVPDRICHLESRRLTLYSGNYEQFARQRQERLVLMEKNRQKQEAKRAHMQAFVDRFRYKASKARQAQSRLKMLEKMEPIMSLEADEEVRFVFPTGAVPAPPLVTMEKARAAYEDKTVLDGLGLRIDPDDRIALLGKNGNGKSTFAKLVAGRMEPARGEVVRARGFKVGFFAQHQIEDLEPEADSIEHIRARRPQEREQQIRERLARFGLGAEKAKTKAKNLSGGEKTRLAMALMCLDEPNLLILDEPTNHLDIDSRDALVEAINGFEGAVIIVSHDRHLVELTADRLWLVANGNVAPFEGDVDDYKRLLLQTSGDDRATASLVQPNGRAPVRLKNSERRSALAPLRKKARAAEDRLERLQSEKGRIEALLAAPGAWTDPNVDAASLQRRIGELTDAIGEAEAAWLEIEAEIEAIEAA